MHKTCFVHKSPLMQKSGTSPSGSTLSEQAFRRLRHDVLRGGHPPGTKLKLDTLQVQYGYSSSPLREALNRLAQEGLVQADERKGFRVGPVSVEDFSDITRMRLMLDLPALRESLAHGDDAWEAGLMATFHQLELIEARLSDGPVVLDDEWSSRHKAFHMALLSACPSERQRAWCESLFDQAERYRYISARHRTAGRRKSDEHRRLLQAALRRDPDTACALMDDHVRSTERNVQAALKQLECAGR